MFGFLLNVIYLYYNEEGDIMNSNQLTETLKENITESMYILDELTALDLSDPNIPLDLREKLEGLIYRTNKLISPKKIKLISVWNEDEFLHVFDDSDPDVVKNEDGNYVKTVILDIDDVDISIKKLKEGVTYSTPKPYKLHFIYPIDIVVKC